MTPAELRAAQAILGLRHRAMAKALGVAMRTWQSWVDERDQRTIPETAIKLLHRLVDDRRNMED